jgi:hypothetical protein
MIEFMDISSGKVMVCCLRTSRYFKASPQNVTLNKKHKLADVDIGSCASSHDAAAAHLRINT